MPPARETDRTEVLVALDLATGVVLAEEPLPTSWRPYEFQQPLGPVGSGVLFLDATRVLAAVGEDPWEEECRHVLLDATDLRPRAGITYPRGGEPVSRVLPLGDGTWLTFDGDTVRRWRTG
ncbi:hypothetical protein ACFV2S_02045 [Streptomyces sp. NPDC059695]|uniref:hypothetical protein n=1 Tax=Streptomyces sp. NPDC059695 TaxID=3346910 RepID=UPI0036C0EC66